MEFYEKTWIVWRLWQNKPDHTASKYYREARREIIGENAHQRAERMVADLERENHDPAVFYVAVPSGWIPQGFQA
jgi:hypothetical protein